MRARRLIAVLLAAAGAASLAAGARAQTPGLVPLNDLGAGTYAGFPGGLYPGSQNTPPAAHLAEALARAAQIVPRDAAGNPDPDGWIGMIAVGMSNPTHEFGAFEVAADRDTTRNARVVILDTAFGGQNASAIANPDTAYWTVMTQRLAAMGLTAAQVQVCWVKEAEPHPANDFPIHALALRDTLKQIVRNLHDKFPHLRIVYLSSRIYGGYAGPGGLNPEPQAYESGFAVKWLIEDQIDGDPGLNHGHVPGDVRAPLLLWGPYLWANGPTPRSDGLTWEEADLESDDVHPSPSGEQKVAAMLAAFFASDTTAAPWWPAQPGARLAGADAIHDAHVVAATPGANFGGAVELIAQGGASPANAFVRFDVSGETRPILLAKLGARVTANGMGGGAVRAVADATWDESTITWSTAPAIGAPLVALPPSSRDGTIGAQVTATVLGDADGQVAFALTTGTVQPVRHHSAEGAHAPRLVLVVATPVADAAAGPPPLAARLRAARPNPASGVTSLELELPAAARVEVAVHGVDGRRVRVLDVGLRAAGAHGYTWDGADERGRAVPPGLYFVRWRAGASRGAAKLVRVR